MHWHAIDVVKSRTFGRNSMPPFLLRSTYLCDRARHRLYIEKLSSTTTIITIYCQNCVTVQKCARASTSEGQPSKSYNGPKTAVRTTPHLDINKFKNSSRCRRIKYTIHLYIYKYDARCRR